MGPKAEETTPTSTMHLAQELLMKVWYSGGSRSFEKEKRPLKISTVPATGSWQRPPERIIEADPLTAKWEVPEALTIDHSMAVQHLKQIVKVRKLDKCVPHELTENKIKKKSLFWSIVFSYVTQQQWTIFKIRLWCAMRSGFYTTSGDHQFSG